MVLLKVYRGSFVVLWRGCGYFALKIIFSQCFDGGWVADKFTDRYTNGLRMVYE